jgi:AraC-like DNA-binding protein
MPEQGRDRLRELLDAVLDEDNHTLDEMADDAYASPYHFSRQLSRGAGEPPVAMKRRVLLERAAWELKGGATVTEVAFEAGYESVEGFARAFARSFGHPPSATAERAGSHWLPAPNGIHFHPPMSLWVDSTEASGQRTPADVSELMLHHDVEDVRDLLDAVKGLSREAYERVRVPGSTPIQWDGPDESLAQVMRHLVLTREVWLAAIEGGDYPDLEESDPVELARRHEEAAPRWLAMVRDLDRRGAWGDRVVDALCEPPESFVLGTVVAHVFTYSAHRRQLARLMLRDAGVTVDDGDPITWHRRRTGGVS